MKITDIRNTLAQEIEVAWVVKYEKILSVATITLDSYDPYEIMDAFNKAYEFCKDDCHVSLVYDGNIYSIVISPVE